MRNEYFEFLYECPPLDWFEALKSFEEYLEGIKLQHEGIKSDNVVEGEINEAITLLMEACYIAAKNSSWEGDIRTGPFVVGLPGDCDAKILIIFKQDNDGTTFLLSPVELPYLKGHERKIKK